MVALRSAALSNIDQSLFSGRRVAVVLNLNARKVDGKTVKWVRSVVPHEDLYVSHAPEDGVRIADEIVAGGYEAVLWGGGDGTFAAGVAALSSSAARHGVEVPDVGVLPLGTGNAVAEAVGARPATRDGLADELRRARLGASRRSLQMLNFEGRPTMFAGFGLDALILNDFENTVDMLKRTGLARRIRSAGVRYGMAVVTRSVPRFCLEERAEVVAINRGSPAIRVDVDGNRIGKEIPAGRVLWRGVATLASASTIPYYGLGMKLFPHAERLPGRFQLRLADIGALTIIANLPTIWQGRFQHPQVHDYLMDAVELVLSRPAPFQSGGDRMGDRSRVLLSLWDRPIVVV